MVKRDGPCMYHLATKLKLKDPNQLTYKYPHSMEKCRYRHFALNTIRRDKAETAAKNCGIVAAKNCKQRIAYRHRQFF